MLSYITIPCSKLLSHAPPNHIGITYSTTDRQSGQGRGDLILCLPGVRSPGEGGWLALARGVGPSLPVMVCLPCVDAAVPSEMRLKASSSKLPCVCFCGRANQRLLRGCGPKGPSLLPSSVPLSCAALWFAPSNGLRNLNWSFFKASLASEVEDSKELLLASLSSSTMTSSSDLRGCGSKVPAVPLDMRCPGSARRDRAGAAPALAQGSELELIGKEGCIYTRSVSPTQSTTMFRNLGPAGLQVDLTLCACAGDLVRAHSMQQHTHIESLFQD